MQIRRNVRKLAGLAAGTLLVGSTLLGGALAYDLGDFPAPFATADSVNSVIVVGSQGSDPAGLASDIVGAINIGAALAQAGVESQTVTVTCEATSAGVTGGVSLSTTSNQLHPGDAINKHRQTLTKDDLPTVLADGTVEAGGTTYKYQQFLTVGSKVPKISDGGELDYEVPMVEIGTDASQPLYTLKVSFSKPLDLEDAVEDSAEIELFGKTFKIDSYTNTSTDVTSITLYGASQVLSLDKGQTATFTDANGEEHTLENVAVIDENTAVFRLDGELKQKDEGAVFTVGGIEVKVDTVIQINSQESSGLIKFSIGSEKVVLKDGENVRMGKDEERVDGTQVTIQSASSTELSTIEIAVAAQDNDKDFVVAGQAFTDPIFGTFKFAYGGSVPASDSPDRELIEVQAGDDEVVKLSMTDERGYQKSIEFAYDPDTTTTQDDLELADGDGNNIIVLEGADVVEDEYLVVNSGDFTHLLKLQDIDVSTYTDEESTVTFTDVFSGEDYDVTVLYDGTDWSGSFYLEGQEYHVYVPSGGTSVKVTWGSNADADDVGDETTVFPYLETDKGAKVAFVPADGVNTGIDTSAGGATGVLELPTGTATYNVVAANNITVNSVNLGSEGSLTIGGVDYYFDASGSTLYVGLDNGAGAMLDKVAVLLVEEDDSDNNVGAIVVPVQDDQDTGDDDETVVATGGILYENTDALVEAGFNGANKNPFNHKNQDEDYYGVDRYGTILVYDDEDQWAKVLYPDEQAITLAAFGPDPQFEVTGGSSSQTVECKVPSLPATGIAKLDTEAEAIKETTNLILVGGPAVNSLVAELADKGKTMTLDDWRSEQDGQRVYEGTAIIQYIDDAFAQGKAALVVAGYSAEDTRNACYVLQNYKQYADDLKGKTKVKVVGKTVEGMVE